MPLLDLTYGQEKLLMDQILRDNPELMNHQSSFYAPLGDVIDHGDGTASVFLLGLPGKETAVQVSGKVYSRYRRLDLDTYLKAQPHNLKVYRPASTAKLLEQLQKQWGVIIPVDAVVAETLERKDSGNVVIQLTVPTERSFVLTKTSFTLSYSRPNKYPLSDVILTRAMSGYSAPTVQPNWSLISTDWLLPSTEIAKNDLLWQLTPGQSVPSSELSSIVTTVSNSTVTSLDVTGATVSFNAPNDRYCGSVIPDRRAEIVVPGNVGALSVFYNAYRLSNQPYFLPDRETTLRGLLTETPVGENANARPGDVLDLFRTLLGESVGPWVNTDTGIKIRNVWDSTLAENQVVNLNFGNASYNRRALWLPKTENSITTVGGITVYYNATT